MNRQHSLGVSSVKAFCTLQRISFDDLLIDDNSISKSDFYEVDLSIVIL